MGVTLGWRGGWEALLRSPPAAFTALLLRRSPAGLKADEVFTVAYAEAVVLLNEWLGYAARIELFLSVADAGG
jgi:hypothetical protein